MYNVQLKRKEKFQTVTNFLFCCSSFLIKPLEKHKRAQCKPADDITSNRSTMKAVILKSSFSTFKVERNNLVVTGVKVKITLHVFLRKQQ